MAQKTGAISLRIANKTIWNSVWSEDNKTYYHFLFQDLEIKKYIRLISNFLGLKAAKTLVKPQNGSMNINIKQVSLSQAYKKDKLFRLTKSLSFIKNHIVNVQKRTNALNYKRDLNLWESKALFFFVPARWFSDFIALQIKLSPKHRNNSFKFGVPSGIQSLLRYYYNKNTRNFVSGIKVICKGKWTKSNSGRTQKFIWNLGSLNNQTFSFFIDSHISTFTTKFGACSVKILISYNKVESRF